MVGWLAVLYGRMAEWAVKTRWWMYFELGENLTESLPLWIHFHTASQPRYLSQALYSRVEGFSIFLRFSKTDTMLAIRCIFMGPIPKKRRIWQQARFAHARQNFSFSKNQRGLKNEYFLKFASTFSLTAKNNRRKENLKFKYFWIFILAAKLGRSVYDLINGKRFSLNFELSTKSKKTFPPGAGLGKLLQAVYLPSCQSPF